MDLVSVHSVSPCKPPRSFRPLLSFRKVLLLFSFLWLVGWLVGFRLLGFRKFNPMEEIRVKKKQLTRLSFLKYTKSKIHSTTKSSKS
uniref:Transmembrane protein n=1 Tax=Mus musculus TaxID=10090 RepID=Q3U051_MOUSE|nr:unnamed protein product [Mus musculus]